MGRVTAIIDSLLGGAPNDSRAVSSNELQGAPDGPGVRLPSGIVVFRRRVGTARVTDAELHQALRGIAQLPLAHQRAVAQAGVPIFLIPSAGLEDGTLGMTNLIQPDGSSRWQPTYVRVAVRTGRTGVEDPAEVVQHELGHVLAVLQGQNLSEQAAEAYARAH